MTETSSAPRTVETRRKKTMPSPTPSNPVGAAASEDSKGQEVEKFHLPRRPRVWPD